MTHQPSKYQTRIYDFVLHGTGDAVVDSVPGSGKTTTLVDVANLLPSGTQALFCAFNKHIAVELEKKLPKNVKAQTINSLGAQTLRENRLYATLDEYKYRGHEGIVSQFVERFYSRLDDETQEELLDSARALVDLARLTLTGPTSVEELTCVAQAFNERHPSKDDQAKRDNYLGALRGLAAEYDLGIPGEREARVVVNSIVEGIRLARGTREKRACIDFTDQVYLPVVLRLTVKGYDWVFVDEAQDLNRCQLNLVCKARRAGGRMLFVGDRNQAIYMFAGADCGSMDRIEQVLGATRLPLSICYRCPASHVDLAAKVFPGIEARDNAPQGELSFGVEEDWAVAEAEITTKDYDLQDIFICRNTAPLVALAYRLIRAGKPAKVRGKKIGEGLTALVKKAARWGRDNNRSGWENFEIALDGFIAEKAAEARENLPEEKALAAIEALNDKAETIKVIIGAKHPESLTALKDAIVALFDDKSGNTIWLCTIHRAKGLEARRVFLAEPQLIPSKYAKSESALRQELNIKYIAYSRAKQSLFILRPHETGADSELAA